MASTSLFPQFLRLPLELQLMIVPYAIEDEFDHRNYKITICMHRKHASGLPSLPAVFHANRLLRTEATRYCNRHSLFTIVRPRSSVSVRIVFEPENETAVFKPDEYINNHISRYDWWEFFPTPAPLRYLRFDAPAWDEDEQECSLDGFCRWRLLNRHILPCLKWLKIGDCEVTYTKSLDGWWSRKVIHEHGEETSPREREERTTYLE